MRTRIQTLDHIRAQFEAGKLGAMNGHGGCIYEDPKTGTNCAVGCVLTPEQMAEVNRTNRQHQNLQVLDTTFEEAKLPSLFQVTGFNNEELYAIQTRHDDWAKAQTPIGKEERGALFMEYLGVLVAKEPIAA